MLGSCRWENMCHAFHAFALADVTAFQRVPGDLVGWFGTQVAGWWKPFSDRCRSRNADCKGGIVRCHSSPTNRRKKDLTREWQRQRTRRKEMWNSPCVDCASRNSMTLQTLWDYETWIFTKPWFVKSHALDFLAPVGLLWRVGLACWASWLGRWRLWKKSFSLFRKSVMRSKLKCPKFKVLKVSVKWKTKWYVELNWILKWSMNKIKWNWNHMSINVSFFVSF